VEDISLLTAIQNWMADNNWSEASFSLKKFWTCIELQLQKIIEHQSVKEENKIESKKNFQNSRNIQTWNSFFQEKTDEKYQTFFHTYLHENLEEDLYEAIEKTFPINLKIFTLQEDGRLDVLREGKQSQKTIFLLKVRDFHYDLLTEQKVLHILCL
jgi:hypothetical protein